MNDKTLLLRFRNDGLESYPQLPDLPVEDLLRVIAERLRVLMNEGG